MRFEAPFDAILSHKSAARVPGVSQQLATMLMLFDRLVTGQVVPMNPAAAVPRLNHVVNTGKALVLEAAKSTPAVILRDLRDRALLATLIYFFGRITAAEDEGSGRFYSFAARKCALFSRPTPRRLNDLPAPVPDRVVQRCATRDRRARRLDVRAAGIDQRPRHLHVIAARRPVQRRLGVQLP
jgi:hypothetical protein